MKRLIALIVLLLLCGCTQAGDEAEVVSPSPTQQVATTTAPTATPAAMPTATPTAVPTSLPTPEPIVMGGSSYPHDATEIDLSSTEADYIELQTGLEKLTELKRVNLGELPLSISEVAELKSLCPNADFEWSFTLLNRQLNTSDSEVDLSKTRIGDTEELAAALTLFHAEPIVDLSGCNLSHEQLALLREQAENVKVVWTVRFKRWSLRTDALTFSTWQYEDTEMPLDSQDVDALRYCTELVALDLGHNEIRDISFLEPLKELKILILADNDVTDISVLAKLDKLMYLELFLNKIKDISPLQNKEALLDLNLCFNKFTDIEPILSCKNLERIWACRCDLTEQQVQQIRGAFPDATFDFESRGSTSRGWREHPRYSAMTQMLKEKIVLEPFN